MKVNVTDTAAEQLKKTLKDKDMTNKYVRVHISGFGWGGPTFGLALDERNDDDMLVESNEINIIVNKDIIDQYGSFSIDFSNNWLRKGFVVSPSYGGSSCS